ncbi:flagellar hook-associated protein 2 [Hydrogenophaga palleronii]|uniref:Flagellar hook-associated protein 2 n=1 Tax=Hydrogenophaga palleronii TaxID=65655 RepID=A0ABU1WNQ6_9BURK|nr:flagellar filament capping protein FliD [Hydrogenophaga palleronii]MDR7150935.1 flagellar hook-associated protein 2 [Hydrogenophaga palleronii]
MAISSPGLASGIDIQGIVSKLVALEQAPLIPLQQKAASLQSKLSIYGSIKSMVSGLADAAAKLSAPSAWTSVRGMTSMPDAVNISVAPGTAATSMAIEVQSLAKAQSVASGAVPVGTAMGGGSLSIQIGNWSGGSFAPGSATAVPVDIAPGDTLSQIATKINAAGAGVNATVLRDASGERLLVRSNTTGEVNGFRIQATDDDGDDTDADGLSRLAFDPGTASGMTQSQAGSNAQATVNNVPITSATNTITDALPGITLTLSKATTGPAEVSVGVDRESMRKNIQAFVDAYNTINNMLATATKYDPDTKVAGSLQGDSTAVGLQNALRGMMRSVTASEPYSRLMDVGIEMKTGGVMSINTSKLDAALQRPQALQSLFAQTSSVATERGFGLKVKAFADGLLSVNGLVSTRTEALKSAGTRNTKEMEKVSDRAARAEVRYLAQYNAMDAAVGQLSGLNAFVTQQITLWNNIKR